MDLHVSLIAIVAFVLACILGVRFDGGFQWIAIGVVALAPQGVILTKVFEQPRKKGSKAGYFLTNEFQTLFLAVACAKVIDLI
jgi:hypothetical protein